MKNYLLKKCSYVTLSKAILLFFLINASASQIYDPFLNPDIFLFDDSIEVITNAVYRNPTQNKKKPFTYILYVSADNDLRNFAARNIKQAATIGSNENINIVAQIDIRVAGNHKITRRYFIEKNKITHVNANDPYSQKMDSGDPKTLISFCKWAIEEYPAEEYGLGLWNHGTGVVDPIHGRIINPVELFSFNPIINKFELDRTIGFLDLVDGSPKEQRGVCWDDSTGNYLTNQKQEEAFRTICNDLLGGKKLAIIAYDACLMSMIEVCNIVKKYAHIMVSSQEVELGTGWDYGKVFMPFEQQALNRETFATHIVNAYAQTYNSITNDYTQSAIDLKHMDKLEQQISNIAQLLMDCLSKQKNGSVKKALWASHSKSFCTHFDEPSYVDMYHLFSNIQDNLRYFDLTNHHEAAGIKASIYTMIEEAKETINQAVIANKTGKNLQNARGISIYFPEQRMHASYHQTTFAAENLWYKFLKQYLIM